MVNRRDVIKAGAVSIALIAGLIAIEFVWVRNSTPEPFQTRYGTHVLDFLTLPGEKIGAFVVAETSDSLLQPVRYRAGFIHLDTGRPMGEKIALTSRSQSMSLLPDGTGVMLACWDGEIVTMRPSADRPLTESVKLDAKQVNRLLIVPEHDRWLVNSSSLLAVSNSAHAVQWRSEFAADDSLGVEHFQGRVYCGLGSGKLVQLDAESGAVLDSQRIADRAILSISITPDGKSMATLLSDGQLIVGPGPNAMREKCNDEAVALKTSESNLTDSDSSVSPLEGWRIASTTIFRPSFSPCGRTIVAPDHEDNDQICLFDSATGEKLKRLGSYRGSVGARWSEDASTLYVWGYDGRIHSRAIHGGEEFWCSCPVKDHGDRWRVLVASAGSAGGWQRAQ